MSQVKRSAAAAILSPGRARRPPGQTAFRESFRPPAGLVPRPPGGSPSLVFVLFMGRDFLVNQRKAEYRSKNIERSLLLLYGAFWSDFDSVVYLANSISLESDIRLLHN
jgi:hypothetical protein